MWGRKPRYVTGFWITLVVLLLGAGIVGVAGAGELPGESSQIDATAGSGTIAESPVGAVQHPSSDAGAESDEEFTTGDQSETILNSPRTTQTAAENDTNGGTATNTTTLVVRFEPYNAEQPSTQRAAANNTTEARKTHAEETKAAFRDRFGNATVETQSADAAAVTIHREFWLANAALVEVNTDRVPRSALLETPGVERVHKNHAVTIEAAGAKATQQTANAGSERTSAEPTTTTVTEGLVISNVPAAWERVSNSEPGTGATVAVLDTGIDDDHKDLAVAAGGWAAFDAYGQQITDSVPHDKNGHGTHVAGTVAGPREPAGGGRAYGVAPGASLYGVKVLNENGSGTFSQVLAGMQWATDQADVDIIQMSLGADGTYDAYIEPVRAANAAGKVVVASVGNNGENTSGSPANVYDALSVGAVDTAESVATFSGSETLDRDAAWDNPPADWPREYDVPVVVAPGVSVESAAAGSTNDTILASGTSMAAPHVAGVAALVIGSLGESPTVDEVETALTNGAREPDGADGQSATRYGDGIIDAENSLAAAGVGELTVSIDTRASDLNVSADENVTVVVDIKNTGETALTQDLVAEVDGEPQASLEEVTLAAGAAEQRTLTFEAMGGFDGQDITVRSATGADTARLQINGITVGIDETASTLNVTDDDDIVIAVNVTNRGDTTATRSIVATVDGHQQASTDVTLAGGERDTVTLRFAAKAAFDGQAVTVRSDSDAATAPLSVAEVGKIAVSIDAAASDLDVVEDENISVIVTLENTGDVALTQGVTATVDDVERASSDAITLGGGEETQTTLVFAAEPRDDDEAVTVSSETATDTAAISVAEIGQFAVEIDTNASALSITTDETVVVEVAVTNTGETTLTQSIGAAVGGVDQSKKENVTLSGGETTTMTLSFVADAGFDGQNVTISSADDTDTAPLSVAEVGAFTVAINNTASDITVTSDDQVNVTVEVGNTGETTLSQSVVADVAGDQQASIEDVVLAGGETETLTLSFPADEIFDGHNVTISSADATDTAALAVAKVGMLTVGIDEEASNLTVTNDETIRVTAAITNTGETTLSQSVYPTVAGKEQASAQNVSLIGGETETLNLSFPADAAFDGQNVTVRSADDTDTAPLSVAEVGTVAVAIDAAASDLSVTTEEQVSVAVEVTNTGETTLSQSVRATVDGEQQAANESVRLAGGDTEIIPLAFPADAGFDGQNVTVSSDDAAATAPLSVATVGEFAVAIDENASSLNVTDADAIVIEATVTNTGEVTQTQPIAAEINGHQQTSEPNLTLAGGETAIVRLSLAADATFDGQDVTVLSDDQSDTATVSVADIGEFDISIAEQASNLTVTSAEDVAVEATVTNTGETTLTQSVIAAVNGTQQTIEPNVTLAGGDTTTLTLVFDAETGFDGANVTIRSDDTAAMRRLSVTEPTRAVLSELEIAGQGANATVVNGTSEPVNVTVTNRGEVAGTVDVVATVTGGESKSLLETVTVAAGVTEHVTIENVTDGLSPGSYTVTVATEASERDGTLRVEPEDTKETAAGPQEGATGGTTGGGGGGGPRGGVGPAQVAAVTFEVSSLTPSDIRISQSDTVTVSATLTTGAGAATTQTIQYRIDGTVIAERDVQLVENDQTVVTFTDIETTELPVGNYTHGVYSADTNATGTLISTDDGSVASSPTNESSQPSDEESPGENDTVGTETTTAPSNGETVSNETTAPDSAGSTDGITPGFGVIAAVLALLSVASVARHQT